MDKSGEQPPLKGNPLSRFSSVFFKRFLPQKTPEPTSQETPIVPPPKQEIIPDEPKRQEGIGIEFLKSLAEKGIIEEPKIERFGVSASEGRTNEIGSPVLFEEIKNQKEAPNGYLVGVGAANIFSMLEAFPKGTEPKAILLFDIDQEVVEHGRQIIEELKSSDSYPEKNLGKLGDYRNEVLNNYFNMDPRVAVEKYASLLHRLAKEGNLVITKADFTDQKLMEEISRLPEWKSSNNIVYLSNIADHLQRYNESKDWNFDFIPDFSFLNTLTPEAPHKNYYIDTLQRSLSYNLRVGTKPPVFVPEDFPVSYLMYPEWQTRPTNEINGPTETNPLWENIHTWASDQIIQSYHQLDNSPLQQERKELMQEKINDHRKDVLKRYDYIKKEAQNAPHQMSERWTIKYVVPETQEEEDFVKASLSEPYNYNKDFIPYIATFWEEAITPDDIPDTKLPKYDQGSFDPETHKYHTESITDPRRSLKGNVEVYYLKRLSFEELAMAKLYCELKRRLEAKDPRIEIKGKSFEELAEMLKL